MSVVRIVLVDDHAAFRDVMRFLFQHRYPDIVVVGDAQSGADALAVVDRTDPDVVLLDVSLAAGESGLDVARELVQRRANRRILMLTMAAEARHAQEALKAGATGYATKDLSAEDLARAVRLVAAGGQYLSPSLIDSPGAPLREKLEELTPREREIFDLAVAGFSSDAIADRFGISRRTVETHRSHILHKLGLQSPVEMVRFAAHAGVLPA